VHHDPDAWLLELSQGTSPVIHTYSITLIDQMLYAMYGKQEKFQVTFPLGKKAEFTQPYLGKLEVDNFRV
jgi:hypothetical protein